MGKNIIITESQLDDLLKFVSNIITGKKLGNFDLSTLFGSSSTSSMGMSTDFNKMVDKIIDNYDFKNYKYKIGVIDFGIVGKFSREMQNTVFHLFKGLYEKKHNDVAHCIINNLVEPKDKLTNEKKNELVDIISKYSEDHFGKDTHKFLDAEDMITINKILYNYGVQFSKEFCKVELSFAISDSVCKLLSNKTTYIDQLLNIFSNSP